MNIIFFSAITVGRTSWSLVLISATCWRGISDRDNTSQFLWEAADINCVENHFLWYGGIMVSEYLYLFVLRIYTQYDFVFKPPNHEGRKRKTSHAIHCKKRVFISMCNYIMHRCECPCFRRNLWSKADLPQHAFFYKCIHIFIPGLKNMVSVWFSVQYQGMSQELHFLNSGDYFAIAFVVKVFAQLWL